MGGALFWIGRIDVPFLADNVSIAGMQIDMVPAYYLKDILVHEAHRHPYMERLGQMYLMKMRYRDTFLTEAGNAWRQLIILAFMPWMARYRVFSDERKRQSLEALRRRNKQKDNGEEADDE